MATPTITRLAGPMLGALVLLATSGCAGGATNSGNAPIKGGAPRLDARDAFPAAPTGSVPAPPTQAGTANCAQDRCTVRLAPTDGAVDALGTHLTLNVLSGNRAVFGVGNEQVRCLQGETVFAQPFSLTCSQVGRNQVTVVLVRGD